MSGKMERQYLAHYIDVHMGKWAPLYVRLGKDLEAYSEELNPQVEIKRSLSGVPLVSFSGYQVQSEVETYYAYEGDPLFSVLSNIANNRYIGEACKTTRVDALFDSKGVQIWAYREDCVIAPMSVGGDTSGVQIPFAVYNAGNRVFGKFDPVTKVFDDGVEPSPEALKIGVATVTPAVGQQRITAESQGLDYFSQVIVKPITYREEPNDAGGISVIIGVSNP